MMMGMGWRGGVDLASEQLPLCVRSMLYRPYRVYTNIYIMRVYMSSLLLRYHSYICIHYAITLTLLVAVAVVVAVAAASSSALILCVCAFIHINFFVRSFSKCVAV